MSTPKKPDPGAMYRKAHPKASSLVEDVVAARAAMTNKPLPNRTVLEEKTVAGRTSSYSGATVTIDGVTYKVHNGRNVIFLKTGGTRSILAGGNTINYGGEECGENTLNIP